MFALGLVQAGLVSLAVLFSLQAPDCVSLGATLFGPEFTKAYNTPSEAEKKALEEQKAEEARHAEAVEHLVKAYSDDNIRKGKNMDFTEINKAVDLRPNDTLYVGWKYAMLVAAGKTEEAAQIGNRMDDLFTKQSDASSVSPIARRYDTATFSMNNIYSRMDPNDPNRAKMKDEMCKQYTAFFAMPNGGGYGDLALTRQAAAKAGC